MTHVVAPVVALVLTAFLLLLLPLRTSFVAPRRFVSKAIPAVVVIADGMHPPIGMPPHPHIETLHAGAIANDPDIAGAQIIRYPTNVPDVFEAVPDIDIRNFHFHHRCRGYDDRRGWGRHRHNWRPDVYPPWLHDTTCH